MSHFCPLLIRELISNFLHSRSLSMERQFLLLKKKKIQPVFKQEPCCFLNLPIKALIWAKMKEKSEGARRKKVRFHACANLKREKFCKIHKDPFKPYLNWKAPPSLSSPKLSNSYSKIQVLVTHCMQLQLFPEHVLQVFLQHSVHHLPKTYIHVCP